jgi:hypothetical protein
MRKPCLQCGGVVSPSGARGLCHKCYEKGRYHRRKQGVGKWSTKFDACIKCGKTAYPHAAKGACKKCYSAERYDPSRHRVWQYRALAKRKYGLTQDQLDAMYAAQGGVCAICQKAETKQLRHKSGTIITQRLSVDEDHSSKKVRVRGLLCNACNHGLGNFRDDPKRLRAAAIYIEEHREKETVEKERRVLN